MEDEATDTVDSTDHTVVVSITVKAESKLRAKVYLADRLNNWFNDLNTMMDGRGSKDVALDGALLNYSILDPTYSVIVVDGAEYVAKV